MLLDDKRLLITGGLTEASIAFSVAKQAQEAGAQVLLSGFGRGLSITQRVAKRLPHEPDVIELDVTDAQHLNSAAAEVDARWGRLDGLVHAVGFAPPSALGGGFMTTPWEDVATTVHVSTYSFAALASAFAPLLKQAGGGSVVGLDFDATVAWPGYDWMGVAKAALESACRYVARDLGAQNTRVNLVAAGPLRTMAKVVCALLSDWMPAVTGEVVHVDGGAHAMGGELDA